MHRLTYTGFLSIIYNTSTVLFCMWGCNAEMKQYEQAKEKNNLIVLFFSDILSNALIRTGKQ